MRKRNIADDLQQCEAFRIPQAATSYNVGEQVVRKAIERGELQASKLGDSPRSPIVITRRAMERWLDSRRMQPAHREAA